MGDEVPPRWWGEAGTRPRPDPTGWWPEADTLHWVGNEQPDNEDPQ